MKKDLNNDFSTDLKYILTQLESNINEANNLEDKIYFELSKKELVNYIKSVYSKIKDWNSYYKLENYDLIINEYNEVESIISELELCLADYEDKFHMNGISYSLFRIGKILSKIKKESDENGGR